MPTTRRARSRNDAGPVAIVTSVQARIDAGEFVAILGHAGSGRSALLSMIAGFRRATCGGVVIDDAQALEPGPERAMVFQSPCLLPWLTARQNVALAAERAPRGARRLRPEAYLEMVGVTDVADELPSSLSLGTQQCVALARALAAEPGCLLLDDPFSMLDSLTRVGMQDLLLRVWEHSGRTVVMVTHDVDEALYLADRLILMTDGPAAAIGETMTVPFDRPRSRPAVLADLRYQALRARGLRTRTQAHAMSHTP
jgi:ABC-type nitrate/sulfonate/bicarbonate transport system ATPase subunit